MLLLMNRTCTAAVRPRLVCRKMDLEETNMSVLPRVTMPTARSVLNDLIRGHEDRRRKKRKEVGSIHKRYVA